MQDNFYINLSECVFGPEELELLLKEWQKDPKPKTINEIAKSYLTHRIKAERGFLPYNCRRQYKEKDRIIVRIRTTTGERLEVAEVVRIRKNGYYDSQDGGRGDTIDIRLLSQDAKLKGKETKTFVANYQGESITAAVSSFEVIREKDENDVIPKILVAIGDDNRFVNFQEHWLPSDLLVSNLSTKLTDVREIIAKCKQMLSTGEILEKVYTDDNAEELGNRLEFSLNYFLECDKSKKFVQISDPDTKWDLRKPSGLVLVTVNEKSLSNGKLHTSSDLELLLFYHGFVGQCAFSFPYNRKITAYHNVSEGTICGEEFINELAKLSENKEYKVKFGHPEQRGDPICVSAPHEPEKIQSTVTIKQEWLSEGVIRVPKRLSSYMKGTNAVHILYDQIEELLPYDESDSLIKDLCNFYSKKALDVFDRVQLQLESLRPTRLFIHPSWRVSLNKLLEMEPQDLDWEQSSVRDCIIIVLAMFKAPAHYREIYVEIATHKCVSWGTIIGTLSRYCPSVFVHVDRGKWQLVGLAKQKMNSSHETIVPPEAFAINDEIWKAVATIEENDYVYKLLQKIAKPLSFDEICRRLADYLKVDVRELSATGFLKADDERLRRLDDGTWALEEWFTRDDSPETPLEYKNAEAKVKEVASEGIIKSNRFWLVLIILLILLYLYIIAGIVLIWLFLYGR